MQSECDITGGRVTDRSGVIAGRRGEGSGGCLREQGQRRVKGLGCDNSHHTGDCLCLREQGQRRVADDASELRHRSDQREGDHTNCDERGGDHTDCKQLSRGGDHTAANSRLHPRPSVRGRSPRTPAERSAPLLPPRRARAARALLLVCGACSWLLYNRCYREATKVNYREASEVSLSGARPYRVGGRRSP